MYLRFGRLAVPVINDRPDYKFEIGKGVVLREGKDLTIVATGLPVAACLEAAEKLAADGVEAKVINIHTIKPLDEELILAAAKETRESRNRRRAFGNRRSGKRCVRLPEREGTHQGDEDRCQRYLRRVRTGSETAGEIWTGCRRNLWED